jgi:OmcA/MtrC family decaheme c-type cytochrome
MGHRKSTAQRFQLLGATVFALAVLAGCGNDGSQGPAGTAGSAPVTSAAGLSADQQQALSITGTVTSVTIPGDGKPVVNFTLKDASGKGITGFGSFKSLSTTATTINGVANQVPVSASYPNIQFALAKLVPADATSGAPSGWLSYIVTGAASKDKTSGAVTAGIPRLPTTDNTGTLDDHGDGTYTYKFDRSITSIQSFLDAQTYTGNNARADLGDVTYVPTAIHRLVIQVGGAVRGTGTNTDNAVQVTASVPMSNPIDIVYDFIPSTGAAVTATDPNGREIVKVSACFECHSKFTIHGGNSLKNWGGTRQDTRYCVVCHTEQQKYGFPNSTASGSPLTYTGDTRKIDGMAVGRFTPFIHRIHMGAELTRAGYNFTCRTTSGVCTTDGVVFSEITFPQDHRNCVKCHDGTATAANVTAQGDNWKNKPTRLACVACHDNIGYADGANHTGGAWSDATTNADTTCANSGCHTPTEIASNHVPVTPPNPTNTLQVLGTAGGNANTNAAYVAANPNNLPAGAIKVTYDVKTVGRDANRNPYIIFRLLQDGVRADFNTFGGKTEIWDNFIGSPTAQFTYAVPQDTITAPADYNQNPSAYIKLVWNGVTSAATATLGAPDLNGYYTLTLTGTVVPDSAVMLTGGIGFGYSLPSNTSATARGTQPLTQTNLPAYPITASAFNPSTGGANAYDGWIGGLLVAAPTVQKLASVDAAASKTYAARRQIVDNSTCNKCHERLGVFTAEAFHAGQRNDANTCAWCHRPNQTSSGWSADSESYIHAIHSAAKRSNPFTWHASSTTASFADVTFPGVLRNCQACHLSGTYDFSASASSSALPNRLYRTVGQGIYNRTSGTPITTYSGATCAASTTNQTDLGVFSLSPTSYGIVAGTNYGLGFNYNAGKSATTLCPPDGSAGISLAAGATRDADSASLVISPITTACFSCHDSSTAMAHMRQNGGSIYAPRSTALATTEQCMVCHGPGTIGAIADMHAKQ